MENSESEQLAKKETELLLKFRKLSAENQIRIEERMNMMLEDE